MRIAFPTPSWPTLPYIPDRTYATASPIAIKMPSSFCAPFLEYEKKLCQYETFITVQNLIKYVKAHKN